MIVWGHVLRQNIGATEAWKERAVHFIVDRKQKDRRGLRI